MKARIICAAVAMLGAVTARADIYQWEWVDPADPSRGKRQSTTLCPGGAGVDAVPYADLDSRDLTQAYLIAANLSGARAEYAILTNADLTRANLSNAFLGADLMNTNLIQADLAGALLSGRFENANFTQANLAGASILGWLENANFTQADLSNAAFQIGAPRGGTNLTNANFTQANLNGVSFHSREGWTAQLTNANFTDAEVRGAIFTDATFDGFTAAQLYSTASYKAKNLTGISLAVDDLTAWNFAAQNLTNADFSSATLNNANLSGADTRGAIDLNYSDAITANTILSNGYIESLDLTGGRLLLVRNYSGDSARGTPPIPILIVDVMNMSMGPDGTLRIEFDGEPWHSTISFSFSSGLPVALGGTLELGFAAGVDPVKQLGRTWRVFDWFGVTPTGTFSPSSPQEWDLSRLYSTGEVTLLFPRPATATHWRGSPSLSWSDPGNWSAGVPASGAVVVFDLRAPPPGILNQDIPALSLQGIVFTDTAGSHTLGGQQLLMTGAAPLIASASTNDQTIQNDLLLAADTTIAVSGSGALNLAGMLAGSRGLTKTGRGPLVLTGDNAYAGFTTVDSGTLTAKYLRGSWLLVGEGAKAAIAATATPNLPTSTSRLPYLFIAGGTTPTGTLDLNNNCLIFDYSGGVGSLLSELTAQIRSGRNGKDGNDQANWNGLGIITSKGRQENVAAHSDLYNLGAINNADMDTVGIGRSFTTFAGQPVTPNTVLVMYTCSGDANLDGVVDGDDYTYWLLGFLNLADPSIHGWLRGDFNYDGVVDGDDYTQWLNTFLLNGPPLAGEGGPAPVPEPSTLAQLGLALGAGCVATAWTCRKRRGGKWAKMSGQWSVISGQC